jgi:hypothetical protein
VAHLQNMCVVKVGPVLSDCPYVLLASAFEMSPILSHVHFGQLKDNILLFFLNCHLFN